jgi:hypothetical protein
MLEIATGLLVYIATSYGNQGSTVQPAPKATARQEIQVAGLKNQNSGFGLNPSQLEVKQKVEAYFADTPLLVQIAQCESHYNQFGKDGQIYRGEVNPADVGVMQINEYYHLDTSKKLGYDIHTLDGNMAYARYLYNHEGSDPWSSSSPCWKKYDNLSYTGNHLAIARK